MLHALPISPPWTDPSNYTWRRVQDMKLLIMQFSAISHHFIANLHNLQFTAASTKTSPALSAFNSRVLVTDINSVGSAASRAQVFPLWRISCNWTLSILLSQNHSQSQCQSQSLPPSSFSWRQAPWGPRQAIFFQLNISTYSPYVTCSLTRGWVCHLQFLLALASEVFLGSESRGTHDHILLSQIRDSSNLEGQVPVFISPRNRVIIPTGTGVHFLLRQKKKRGSIHPLPHTSSRHSASLVKHRDNFTFTLPATNIFSTVFLLLLRAFA
jgi:hypothetical protein